MRFRRKDTGTSPRPGYRGGRKGNLWVSHGLVHQITPEGSVTHKVRGGIFIVCMDAAHLKPDA